MILSNIKQFFKKNKKIFYYLGFFLVVFLLSSDLTFAAPEDSTIVDTTIDIVSTLLKGISLFLGLMTYLATIFLSPEWINGSLFGMSAKFKEVWIMVSNVVYFIFAFILIWIAFMNIIGKGGDQYQLKQALPKFIVGVLIVPFSWFLVQFILSISAILTISALTLPIDTFPDYETKLKDIQIPSRCDINVGDISLGESAKAEATPTSDDGAKDDKFFKCDPDKKVGLGKIISDGNSTNSIYGIISMYTYGITSIDTIAGLDKWDLAKNVKGTTDVAVKLIFDALFIIVYGILIIALGMVLMIRGIYIWIYVMISPVFGLMYFFDKKDGGGDGFFAKFNIKEFIALAMVPVYTMLALSFGMLFIYVVGNGLTTEDNKGSSNVVVDGENSQIIIGGKDNDDSNFILTIKGAAAKSNNTTNLLKSFGNDALGVVGALILKLFGIVILWGTVMAAMRTSEITKAIVEPLHSFGGKVGDIISSAPGNIPIFGGQSANSMGQIAGKYQQAIGQTSIDRASKFAENAPFLKENADTTKALQNLNNSLSGMSNTHPEFKKALESWLRTGQGDTSKLKSNASLDSIKLVAKHFGLADEDIKKFNNGTEQQIIDTILKPIEAKIDATTGGGVTTQLNTVGGTMDKTDLEKLVKDLYSGTARPNSGDTNKIETKYNNNGDVLNIPFSTGKVHFELDGNLSESSYIDFARSITGMSLIKAKEMYNKELKKNNFDEIYEKAKSELPSGVLDTDNGNIKTDFTKMNT